MWIKLFSSLLLAHLLSDFAFQTDSICKLKTERQWRSKHQYIHTFVVFVLSWFVSYDLHFWWCALVVGTLHFLIDIGKSYLKDKVEWFVLDQILHISIILIISFIWCNKQVWSIPVSIPFKAIVVADAALICWKPANIFIRLMLKHSDVQTPYEQSKPTLKTGALIGNTERWLILIFVYLHCYEALGLLIAAKSIIRYGDKATIKTEYVLAGTLMSILIAILSGLLMTELIGLG